ncbi:hypothetical protein A0256_03820 [Mucilaginibacter sp. PAMC 26640]|nr:hypothetical protein A0256_03820 [Mucilaginibacter sp. PAMC 26640]
MEPYKEPNIELAKPRDFGEIVADTFGFIRQNFKSLVKNFFVFCGFFMIAGILATTLSQYKIMSLQNEIMRQGPTTFSGLSNMWLSLVGLFIFGVLGYCANITIVTCFVSLYKHKGSIAPSTEEVWAYFKYYFLRTILAAFVTWVLLGIGFILCLAPGIWLFPIFGLIFPIMIIENGSFSFAFSRAFSLISNNWWVTAGSVFVLWLIAYIMMAVVSIPAQAVNVLQAILKPGQAMPQLSLVTIILSAVLQQFLQILLMIPTIGFCLCYFNLAETKEGTSLLDRINKFGEHNTQPDQPTEEY